MAVDDEFGRHEILHTASIMQSIFETHMLEHGGLKPCEKKLASEISEKLAELYLLIGCNDALPELKALEKPNA